MADILPYVLFVTDVKSLLKNMTDVMISVDFLNNRTKFC